MKKSLVAFAALIATGAFAQSTVTLSGIIDGGIQYNSNVAPGAAKLSQSSAANNRIIFSGVEDLGGGMAATFATQMRYSLQAGTTEGGGARPLFQGETRVGLRGSFGSIRMGRGLTALQAPNGGYIDPWGVETVAGSIYAPGYATDYVAGGEGRTDGFFYDTPNINGFVGSLTISPRKVATTFGGVAGYSKSFYSLAGTYSNGPINALVGFEQNRYGDSLINIGGNYNFGSFKLFAGYGGTKGGNAADRGGVAFAAGSSFYPGGSGGSLTGRQVLANEKIAAWSIGATVPMGAATIKLGYSNVKSDLLNAKRDSKLGVGVSYALSKRTSVYTDLASTSRNNNAALLVANPLIDNSRITAFDLGIRHAF